MLLQEWDPQTQKYIDRNVEKKVTYAGQFKINLINQLFWSEAEIKDKGLQIIPLKLKGN